MKRTQLSVIGALLICLLGLMLVLDYAQPPDLTRWSVVSQELHTSQGALVHVFQTRDEKWRLKADLSKLDPLYLRMLIGREDRFFWQHGGVNPIAMIRGGFQWLWNGKIISGGSTLTMQVARLLEPRPRTLRSKVIEVWRAYQLERRYTKEQILEIYLTLAPYGSNLEGIRAAALSYFGKSTTGLVPSEAALLVALPQAPWRWSGSTFSTGTKEARNRVLKLAAGQGLIDPKTLHIALQDPLPKKRIPLPRKYPHLARRLLLTSKSGISHCILDPKLQIQIEQIAHESLKRVPPQVNLAILIVHHPTRRIVGYLGSGDFFDQDRQGQIDFIRCYRSPGSTLKPFIYGLGFEDGLLKSTTYVLDDRYRFGTYMPDNFDKTFHGMVTIKEALTLSLNIPAVAVLNRIGPQRFLGILEEAGIHPRFPDPQSVAGLSVALGGLGMTLEQLVTLYTALAQGGDLIPLAFDDQTKPGDPARLLSATTAATLTEIMRETLTREFGQAPSDIAVKTGTSYGHRDVWAIGYNTEYVVGVWMGRPDGSPFGIGTGTTLAIPILQQVFTALPKPVSTWQTAKPSPRQNPSPQDMPQLFKQRPHMLFPIDGTVIEAFVDESDARSIVFNASGGKRPYTWMIDGIPYASQVWHPKTTWHPDKPGFYTVTLMDNLGQAETAHIEIQ